jgi:hypothetical protein
MNQYSDDDLRLILSLKNDDLGLDISIESVTILFCERAVPYLLDIIQPYKKSFKIRYKAALAIREI